MKKIPKPKTLQNMCDGLFHKDTIVGFQFTISYNHELGFACSINKSESNVVIDCNESDVASKIINELFPDLPNHPQISDFKQLQPNQIEPLKELFKELGYEVEECDFAGKWIWLRVKCNNTEIPYHVDIIKNKLNEQT